MSDNKSPTHRVYTLLPRGKDEQGKDKSFWLAIGSAWAHNDEAGFNIVLDAAPLDGKLVMRTIKDEPEPEPPARNRSGNRR